MLNDQLRISALNDIGSVGPALAVRNLVKRFGDTIAVNDVSFDVPEGAFFSLLGPSGSGKTTVLRLLGGFETPDDGRIEIDSDDICALPAYRRDIGVVFQRYALFPHMSVAENIDFSLKQRGIGKEERDFRVDKILSIVGLSGFGNRAPGGLSGGQQQRVALARALIFKPRILTMDEPLAALDRRLRERLQQEIRSLQRRLGITTVYVTHDQTEAFAMSDLVAVMNEGKIEQVDTPRMLYEAPRTPFVAQFVGDSNLFQGEVLQDGNALRLADGSTIHFHAPKFRSSHATLLVRPEKICIEAGELAEHEGNALSGIVKDMTFLGETIKVYVQTGGQDVIVRMQNSPGTPIWQTGSLVTLSWALADTVVLK